MNKTMTITLIALVAVVMVVGAVAPMIQYADASHGGPNLSNAACNALNRIINPPLVVQQIIKEHCNIVPPS